MHDFQDVLGQEPVKRLLLTAKASDRVSHAYLLAGEKGLGKHILAKAFARRLLCEAGGDEPCGVCHACRQVEADTHPDVLQLKREKPNSISVEEVRKQLCDEAQIRPYAGKRRIFIVPDAHLMTPQAQNAALKTIEEPPEYVVLLLLTDREEALLGTILSRVVRLRLTPVREEDVREWLVRECGVLKEDAAVAAAFSGGNPGKAMDLAGSEEFRDQLRLFLTILTELPGGAPEKIGQFTSDLLAADPGLKRFPDIARMYLRDILVLKSRGKARSGGNDLKERLIFADREKLLVSRAAEMSAAKAGRILDALAETEDRLRANVNPELLTDLLLRELSGR